jgi:hypothetical protein
MPDRIHVLFRRSILSFKGATGLAIHRSWRKIKRKASDISRKKNKRSKLKKPGKNLQWVRSSRPWTSAAGEGGKLKARDPVLAACHPARGGKRKTPSLHRLGGGVSIGL